MVEIAIAQSHRLTRDIAAPGIFAGTATIVHDVYEIHVTAASVASGTRDERDAFFFVQTGGNRLRFGVVLREITRRLRDVTGRKRTDGAFESRLSLSLSTWEREGLIKAAVACHPSIVSSLSITVSTPFQMVQTSFFPLIHK